MKMKKKVTAVSVAAGTLMTLILSGCENRELPGEVRTVDWYEAHDTERAETLAECQTSPRSLDATPDCVNASRAENNVKAATKWGTESEGVRTTPPIVK